MTNMAPMYVLKAVAPRFGCSLCVNSIAPDLCFAVCLANPADDYVREFTEDVPRYKVLSAGKVMRATEGKTVPAGVEPVLSSTKIDGLIERVTDSDNPLPVVNEAGAMIGEIDRSIIMRAMKSRS